MNDQPTITDKTEPSARKRWGWIGLIVSSLLILLFVIAMPFVQNYSAIRQVADQGGYIQTRPGSLLKLLPDDCVHWLYDHNESQWLWAFEDVWVVAIIDYQQPHDLTPLHNFGELEMLVLFSKQITDADLIPLRELPHLNSLMLSSTQVTNAGLIHLKELKQLHDLTIYGNNVTEAGFVHLKEIPHLEILIFGDVTITDVGLMHLKKLINLKELTIGEVSVTDKMIQELSTALPNCDVRR